MNSFGFFLVQEALYLPFDSKRQLCWVEQSWLQVLLFMTLNTSCQTLLACKVSFEKSADSLMGTHLQVIICFPLAAFKILSLSLIFGILFMMCLRVSLFASISCGTLCTSWTGMSISFTKLGKYFLIIFSQQISNFLFFLFSFWHPYDKKVGTLEVVLEAA